MLPFWRVETDWLSASVDCLPPEPVSPLIVFIFNFPTKQQTSGVRRDVKFATGIGSYSSHSSTSTSIQE